LLVNQINSECICINFTLLPSLHILFYSLFYLLHGYSLEFYTYLHPTTN